MKTATCSCGNDLDTDGDLCSTCLVEIALENEMLDSVEDTNG